MPTEPAEADAVTESAPPPEANPSVRRPPRGSGWKQRAPEPVRFVWDSVVMGWRWLTRMRTALYLLAALAVLSVIGTFVPQEPNVPTTVSEWRSGEAGPGVAVSQVLDAIGAYDMYGSVAFTVLLFLLYLSLTACLVPRIKAWIRLVRRSKPPVVRRVGARDETASFATDATADEVHTHAEELLRRRRWRLRRHDATPDGPASGGEPSAGPAADRGDVSGPAADRGAVAAPAAQPTATVRSRSTPAQVAAEKGLVSREGGSLLFHLSFYVLLAAIVFGQLLTFEGQRGVVEGEAGFRDTAVSYWSYSPGRWFGEGDHAGWRMELEEFHVDWVRDPLAPGAGQPTEFRSDVLITPSDGSEPYRETIDSNQPIDIEGRQVTQLDWGYAPRVVVEVDGEVVHDGFITPTLEDSGAYRGAVKAPAADPDVGLDIFFYPFAPDDEELGRPIPTGAPWDEAPMLLFQQYRGDLQLGATQQTVNELDVSALESEGGGFLRPGQELSNEDVTVRFPELRRWVGFQVSSRPAIPALLAGAALLVGGLIPALYAYRRRLWVFATPDPARGRTLVTVAGRAFQRPDAFVEEHARIVEELSSRVSGSEVTGPEDESGPHGTGGTDNGAIDGGPSDRIDDDGAGRRDAPSPEHDPQPALHDQAATPDDASDHEVARP